MDSSALVAIVKDEPEKTRLLDRLVKATTDGESLKISAATWVEVVLVVDRYKEPKASALLDALLAEFPFEVVPVDHHSGLVARVANRRFGKGFHPAQLNFGDCFAYALAREAGEPLLFKGNDFAQTDVIPAV